MGSHSKSIARNAATVAGATLLSRVLGFLRDLIVAYALGAGFFADAFFVAFRIPNLMRRLFGEGSLTMAFIPVYSRTRKQEGAEAADRMARSTLAWMLVILGMITLLAIVFADTLTSIVAPGFAKEPELYSFTASLVPIIFPYTLFICAVALCMGILNARGHFLAPALAPCILNIVLIASALIAHYLGQNVALYMAWGTLAAGLLQFLFQQPFLKARGFTWLGKWKWKDPHVGKMGRLMGPTVFGAAVYQVNVLMGTLLASFLPVGSVSYLYYADRLVQFPLGVFGLAVSTAALPSLSLLAAEGRKGDFQETLGTALNLTLFISLPALAGLLALNEPIIDLLFGRGRFTMEAVRATAAALTAYGLGLPFIAMTRPMVSAFYALEDTRTPVIVATVCMVVNVGLGWLLMQSMAHVGLAVAVSASSVLNAMALGVLLKRRTGAFPPLLACLGKCLPLSLLVAGGAWLTRPTDWLWVVLIPVWIGLYFFGALALGMGEARMLRDMIRRGRKDQLSENQ